MHNVHPRPWVSEGEVRESRVCRDIDNGREKAATLLFERWRQSCRML